MGWTSGWSSLKEIKEHCLKGFTENIEIIDSKATKYGRNLWIACKDKTTNESFIFLFLLKICGKDWGYKDMDESCGPYEKDCPLKLINKTTGLKNETAVQWREAVKAYHAKLKNNTEVQIGEVVNVYGEKYKITERVKKSYRGVSLKNGLTYTIRVIQIERLEGALGFIMNAAGK